MNSDFASCEAREVCVEAWKTDPHPRVVKIETGTTSNKVMSRLSTVETVDSIPNVVNHNLGTLRVSSFITMFHRHLLLTVKDPVLYLGRCAVIFVTNCIFALVYWNARDKDQQQATNQVWLFMWFMAIPASKSVIIILFFCPILLF